MAEIIEIPSIKTLDPNASDYVQRLEDRCKALDALQQGNNSWYNEERKKVRSQLKEKLCGLEGVVVEDEEERIPTEGIDQLLIKIRIRVKTPEAWQRSNDIICTAKNACEVDFLACKHAYEQKTRKIERAVHEHLGALAELTEVKSISPVDYDLLQAQFIILQGEKVYHAAANLEGGKLAFPQVVGHLSAEKVTGEENASRYTETFKDMQNTFLVTNPSFYLSENVLFLVGAIYFAAQRDAWRKNQAETAPFSYLKGVMVKAMDKLRGKERA